MTRHAGLFALLVTVAACASLEVQSASTTVPATTIPVVATTTTTVPPTTTTTAPAFTLSGKVVDGRGWPIAEASVVSGEVAVETGPGGWFRLVAAQPVDISISKPGWVPVVVPWDEEATTIRVPLEQATIRGLRVAAGAAGDDAMFGRLLALADETAVNAFVFDTKQEGGEVVYDTKVAEAHEIGAVNPWYDASLRLRQAKERGLYTITRIVAFEDLLRVRARPAEKLAGSWLDPRTEAAWDYNIDLAMEACELGFDEIQFDYVRFPAGRTASASGQLDLGEEARVAAIESFLVAARGMLQPIGCSVSADIFGIVVSVGDDQGLGQRPEELSRQLHALSPMVYPSHYSDGWLGYPDPNDYPYEVTAGAIDDALSRMAEGSELRPWIQGFWWSDAQIREAIQAAEDRGIGWIVWNVRSNFNAAALPTDEEVSG